MARRVLIAEVSGGRVGGRPRLGSMDGVKVALGNRGMTVEAAPQCGKIGKSGEPWYICNWMNFMLPFLLGPVFFQTALPCSGGYHLKRGGMPAYMMWLGWTVKRMQLLNIKPLMSSIWAKGCMLMIVCALYNLAWLPLLGGGRKSWCIIDINSQSWLSPACFGRYFSPSLEHSWHPNWDKN